MIRFIVLLVLTAAAYAQTPLTTQQILDRVRDAYTGVRQYELVGELEISSQHLNVPFRIVYRYPDKLRMEGSMGGPTPEPGGTVITDGQITWDYNVERNTYTRESGAPDLDLDLDDDELAQFGIDPSSPAVARFAEYSLAPYRKLASLAAGASVLRVESLQMAGVPVECYVVVTRERNQASETTWVDTKRFRILRMDAASGKTTVRLSFTKVNLNEPVSDGAFSFVPPAGAKHVEKQR